jgi:hypothetical protein
MHWAVLLALLLSGTATAQRVVSDPLAPCATHCGVFVDSLAKVASPVAPAPPPQSGNICNYAVGWIPAGPHKIAMTTICPLAESDPSALLAFDVPPVPPAPPMLQLVAADAVVIPPPPPGPITFAPQVIFLQAAVLAINGTFSIVITNNKTVPITVRWSDAIPWLTAITPASAMLDIAPGAKGAFELTYHDCCLGPGLYTGTGELSGDIAATIPITLEVK